MSNNTGHFEWHILTSVIKFAKHSPNPLKYTNHNHISILKQYKKYQENFELTIAKSKAISYLQFRYAPSGPQTPTRQLFNNIIGLFHPLIYHLILPGNIILQQWKNIV